MGEEAESAACSTPLSPRVLHLRLLRGWDGSRPWPPLGAGPRVARLYRRLPRERGGARRAGQDRWGTRCRPGSCSWASSSPSLFSRTLLVRCPALWRAREGARKAHKAGPQESSLLRRGAHRTPPRPAHLPQPPPGGPGARAAAPSAAPRSAASAGADCKRGADASRAAATRTHPLPLDRRTIFSRNVFCGATSPLRPPAMVIVPAARGLVGGVPARLLTAAGSRARSPRAIPARGAP